MTGVDDQENPFADVRLTDDGFSIPELKWRELVFVGALRREGEDFLRDPSRPLPAFVLPGLFPEGVRLRPQATGGRILVRRADRGRNGPG